MTLLGEQRGTTRTKTSLQTAAGRGRDWEWADANAFVLPWQLNVSDRGDGVRCPGMGMAPGD